MRNEQEVGGASLTKAIEVDGQTVGFEVASCGNTEKPRLKFMGYLKVEPTARLERFVADRIAFFLSLRDDLREFYKLAMEDPPMRPAIEHFYGHKQVKFLTPFEGACWAILAQRIPMAVAHSIKGRLVAKIGSSINLGGVDYRAFPEPEKMSAAGEMQISEVVRNKRKAEYLWAVTEAFRNVDEQWLRTAPYDDVHAWLMDIKGIGEWSANFVMLRSLGRMEELSSVGPDLACDVARMYFEKDEPLSDADVCKVAEKYHVWQGYWAYYVRIYSEFTYVFRRAKPTKVE